MKYIWKKRQELYASGNKDLTHQTKFSTNKRTNLNKINSSFLIKRISKMQICSSHFIENCLRFTTILSEINDEHKQSRAYSNKKKLKARLFCLKKYYYHMETLKMKGKKILWFRFLSKIMYK